MIYTSIPDVPGPRGHDLSIPRKDDIPVYPHAEPLFKAGQKVKAQAQTPSQLKKQIDRSGGWLK